MSAILCIFSCCADIFSASKVRSNFGYFLRISAFFLRSLRSAMTLYGAPINAHISCNFSLTILSGSTNPKPGKLLLMVVIFHTKGVPIFSDDAKILDFPNVNSIFCQRIIFSEIVKKYSELPAICVL